MKLIKMPITQLDPKSFMNYEEHKPYLEGKLILYSERRPPGNSLDFKEVKYRLSSSETIKIGGSISNAKRAVYKMTNSYDSDKILSSEDSDGYLFVYDGFGSSEGSMQSADAPKQIQFRFFHLIKE
ncbi:MAG: hypothetical protein ACW967_02855 [Candidatus Hodarchaeales archaeon]|jgi:hypothetical protein